MDPSASPVTASSVRARARAHAHAPAPARDPQTSHAGATDSTSRRAQQQSATALDSGRFDLHQRIMAIPSFAYSQGSFSSSSSRSSHTASDSDSQGEDGGEAGHTQHACSASGSPAPYRASTALSGDATAHPDSDADDDNVDGSDNNKNSGDHNSDSGEDDGRDEPHHTLSNQSSASTLALHPRGGSAPLAALQALAQPGSQAGSNFASRFKAARASTQVEAGPGLAEKGSLATLTDGPWTVSSPTTHGSAQSSMDPLRSPAGQASSSGAPTGSTERSEDWPARPTLIDDEEVRTMGVAVVGQRDVGKTSIIRKGLRQYGLSRPMAVSDKIKAYAIRCVLDQPAAENIRVLELDSAAFVAASGTELAWPAELSDMNRPGHGKIEGAVICYDAGNLPSLKGVPELLGTSHVHSTHTPMIV